MHSLDPQIYALKKINKKLCTDQKNYTYLLNELKHLRTLRHKNLVNLFEVFESANSLCLVTEFCDGGDLRKKMSQKMSRKSTLVVAKQVLKAIKVLNRHNLVHRDIKPENIMFLKTKKGLRVKLIDFGLCTNFTDKSKTSLMNDKSGTTCYMAPELIGMNLLDKIYDEKVDVYSLGIILYEIEVGLNPFLGKNYAQSLLLNFQNQIDYELVFDAQLRNLIQQMTQKNPLKRCSVEQALQHSIFEELENYSNKDESKLSFRTHFQFMKQEQSFLSNMHNMKTLPSEKQINSENHRFKERPPNWRTKFSLFKNTNEYG